MSSFAALVLAILFAIVHCSPTPLDVQIVTRNARGSSNEDTHAAIARGLALASLQKRDQNHTASTRLDTSWQDVTLFKTGAEAKVGHNVTVKGDIDVTCKTCYIKGLAVAQLDIGSDLSVGQIINRTIVEVEGEVNALINRTENAIETYYDTHNVSEIWTTFEDNLKDGFDFTDILPPNLDLSFDTLNLTAVPNITLTFRFEDLDLDLELGTTLNATAEYTLPLYHSQTPAGISLPNGLQLGAVFTVDLILSVDGSLDMTSGLHLKIEDHVALEIALFGNEVSGIDLKGGHFEFLPVTVESAGASFTASLRVGAKAALSIGDALSVLHMLHLSALQIGNHSASEYHLGGGIEIGVYTDVAKFKTELNANLTDEAACKLEVLQEYSLVLGATAGAQVTLGASTYGPAVDKTTAIYYTTMTSKCAIEPSTTITPSIATTAPPQRRQDSSDSLVTTTVTTTIKRLAVECPPSVTGQCPVSLQTTATVTQTLTATVSGSEEEMQTATYPTPTITPIAFGTGVQRLDAISGSPTSYTPKPTSDGLITEAIDTVQNHKKNIAIGVSVGVGVPVLAILVALLCLYSRRRSYTSVPATDSQTALLRPSLSRLTSSFRSTSVSEKPETERLSSYQET